MKTCHLNDYSVVGPCFFCQGFRKTSSDISQAWENAAFASKIISEFYFIHGYGNAHRRIVILYDYVSREKRKEDVFWNISFSF